jgi:hypothetical protein
MRSAGVTSGAVRPEDGLAVVGEGTFSEAEIDRCVEPVRRYFRAAIATGTPLARAARLRMRGAIKLGRRWFPFRSEELLAPMHGYVWPASVLGGVVRGSDWCAGGEAGMTWRLLNLVPVVRASGPDVARSAAGRAAGEGVWLPTALVPRYGVEWRAVDDEHLEAAIPVAGETTRVQLRIDETGGVRSVHLDRWGDPAATGDNALHPFGLDVAHQRSFACGITMPAAGLGGWFHDTDRWDEGAFFRYEILDLTLVV